MEHEEKIRLLLHPEQYSDEQLQQMLADDPELRELLEQLALTKQAFVKREADEEAAPVDDEWETFYAKHSAEIDTHHKEDHSGPQEALIRRMTNKTAYKIAASFAGILFTVGMAYATVHIVRSVGENLKSTTPEARISHFPQSTAPADTVKTDTTTMAKPIVFDNSPLENMLPPIAAHYNKEVEFVNNDARQLRFYFVWKPEEGLETTLHRLNLFERVTTELNGNKIVVK